MSDLNLRQALALLDSAEREIAAARALLGGTPAAAPSARADVQAARGETGDVCPKCEAKGAKQKLTPIASPVDTYFCGACGYEYSTT